MEDARFYVYEHYKPNCDEPFYVGKGCGNRAFTIHNSNPWWMNIVNKHGFEVRFVAENLSELYSFWLENMCIIGWGRAQNKEGPLVNMTDGGQGVSGWVPSKKWRKERSKRMKGDKNYFYKKQFTEEEILIICERNRGKNNPMYGRTGSKHPNFGKRNPELSARMKTMKGSKNYGWKGYIYMYYPDGTLYGIYETAEECGRANQIGYTKIMGRIISKIPMKRGKFKGFTFKLSKEKI